MFGRSNLGEGALKTEGIDIKKMYLIDPSLDSLDYLKLKRIVLDKLSKRESLSIFTECGLDSTLPFTEQNAVPLSDRFEIDSLIFDELELNASEREEVYKGVCNLVKMRLDKSKSLKK